MILNLFYTMPDETHVNVMMPNLLTSGVHKGLFWAGREPCVMVKQENAQHVHHILGNSSDFSENPRKLRKLQKQSRNIICPIS